MDSQDTIKRLEECLSASCRGFRTCPYHEDQWDAVRYALELVKAQQQEIKELKEDSLEAFQDFVFKQNFDQKVSNELLFHINMQIDFFRQGGNDDEKNDHQ